MHRHAAVHQNVVGLFLHLVQLLPDAPWPGSTTIQLLAVLPVHHRNHRDAVLRKTGRSHSGAISPVPPARAPATLLFFSSALQRRAQSCRTNCRLSFAVTPDSITPPFAAIGAFCHTCCVLGHVLRNQLSFEPAASQRTHWRNLIGFSPAATASLHKRAACQQIRPRLHTRPAARDSARRTPKHRVRRSCGLQPPPRLLWCNAVRIHRILLRTHSSVLLKHRRAHRDRNFYRFEIVRALVRRIANLQLRIPLLEQPDTTLAQMQVLVLRRMLARTNASAQSSSFRWRKKAYHPVDVLQRFPRRRR